MIDVDIIYTAQKKDNAEKAHKWDKLQEKIAQIDKNKGATSWTRDRQWETWKAVIEAMGYDI